MINVREIIDIENQKSIAGYSIKKIYSIFYKDCDDSIGKIKEYTYDNQTYFIYSLHVKENFFGKHKDYVEISKEKNINKIIKAIEKSVSLLKIKSDKIKCGEIV